MKKSKVLSALLAFLMVATALPLQVDAAEITATPIKDGETVVGSPSSKFPENYTFVVANSGDMTLTLAADGSVEVELFSEAGKPIAPKSYSAVAGRIGTNGGYTFFPPYGEKAQCSFVYSLQSGTYSIVLSCSSSSAYSTELTLTLPLQAVATATPNQSTVLVNGETVNFDAYTINSNNYFKLRDLAKVLKSTGKKFEVEWNGEKNAINLVSGKSYTVVGGELEAGDGTNKTANLNTATIYLDGVPVQLAAYTINQNNYFKLRDLGQALDFDVSWNGLTNTIVIDTTKSYTPD